MAVRILAGYHYAVIRMHVGMEGGGCPVSLALFAGNNDFEDMPPAAKLFARLPGHFIKLCSIQQAIPQTLFSLDEDIYIHILYLCTCTFAYV